MGAIIVSIFVTAIAIVGGLYFWLEDRRNARKDA